MLRQSLVLVLMIGILVLVDGDPIKRKFGRRKNCNYRCRSGKVGSEVCGSDGQTYSTNCALHEASCKGDKWFVVAHKGSCTGATKTLACQSHCTKIYKPVCASNGKSYANDCMLQATSCFNGNTITKLNDGRCGRKPKNGTKSGKRKPKSRGCPRNCPRPDSRNTTSPVCGTDGRSYADECRMKMIACRTKKELTVAHPGRCTGRCQMKPCRKVARPTCGSDGRTYGNICLLKNEACSARTHIQAIGEKRCKDLACKPTRCERDFKPVCASDDKQYDNVCMMENMKCKLDEPLTVVKNGPCDKRRKSKKCSRRQCPDTDRRLCGSDGVMYKNLCSMHQASCLQGTKIRRENDRSKCAA